MPIIIQKFGGTSVRDAKGRERVVDLVQAAKSEGLSPVVVVSAMGRRGDPYATDSLLSMISDFPLEAAEVDRLLACGEVISTIVLAGHFRARNIVCRVLSGGEAGIVTDNHFGDARIESVNPQTLRTLLEEGVIPIVAGFQGKTASGEVATLGRGGSDTTAVALGAALSADTVEIFTDVDGIKTADPRIVPQAATIPQMDYEEVFQLAHLGARVIHPRAVEIGRQFGVPIRIRSTFEDSPGTLVAAEPVHLDPWGHRRPEEAVTGITQMEDLVQFHILPETEAASDGWALSAFQELGAANVSVDLINVFPNEAYFCVPTAMAALTEAVLSRQPLAVSGHRDRAKVSVVGSAIRGLPGVMGLILSSLAEVGVVVLQSSDSHSTISVLVLREQMELAVLALHRRFGLGDERTSK